MATIIEFFVPSSFRRKAQKWIRPEEYGKVLPFSLPQKKSAWRLIVFENMGVLHVLVKWLVTVSGTGSSAEQLSNLQNWAVRAQPSDCTVLRISGSGLAGF